MTEFFNRVVREWSILIIPLAVFAFSLIALLWLRRLVYERGSRYIEKSDWLVSGVGQVFRGPSIIWCIIVSIYLGIVVSSIPTVWKIPIGKGLWTLVLISITLALLNVIRELARFYGVKYQFPERYVAITRNVLRILILLISLLITLDIWGLPTTPFILIIALAALAAALVFRDTVPNIFAAYQLNSTREIKPGDYIKLESGEEGYVTEISWRNTRIEAPDGSAVIVPNRRLLQNTVVNYGRPLKKATEPFRFSSHLHMTELTGLKAGNLQELVEVLKKAPDPLIYYHTHHYLEEHHYLTPEPSNDFATWVSDVLGNEALGERLASTETIAFPSLSALRDRLVSVIEDYLAQGGNKLREAMEGREFCFMKSVSFIFPTAYLANDLREFVEALRKISLGSLYFHIFEARLRLSRDQNDFSAWLKNSLDEPELAQEIARIDPYTYTLEGLRLELIQLLERHIK